MIAFMLSVAQGGGGQVGEIARTFGVDWTHLGAQIVSFAIVCAILYRFAYKPVLAVLEERRQQIALGIANAERIKAELDRTEAQRREVISVAHAQASKIIEEARAAAALVLEQDLKKATASAELVIVKAREAAARDHEQMLADLKREVGRLVVQATARVTGKILTPEDHRRLAEETARRVAA